MFQHYINDKLHDFFDIFVTVYIDDILIYSFTLFKYQKPVGVVAEQFTTWVISAIARSWWSGVRILPRGPSFQLIIRLRARLNEAVVGGLHRHPAPGIGADGLAHWSTRLPKLVANN